jgi:hypothetical protein
MAGNLPFVCIQSSPVLSQGRHKGVYAALHNVRGAAKDD